MQIEMVEGNSRVIIIFRIGEPKKNVDVDQSICLFVDLISKACCFGFHVGQIIQLVIMIQLNF